GFGVAAPGLIEISSWGFIFPDLRVNLKPESFRHPPLSYPSLAKWLFIYTVSPVSDFSILI
ncbi:hypothetical protein MLT05_17390, partial [Escherichia coli]|nr:hypothetical protein [Escherichia coli]